MPAPLRCIRCTSTLGKYFSYGSLMVGGTPTKENRYLCPTLQIIPKDIIYYKDMEVLLYTKCFR